MTKKELSKLKKDLEYIDEYNDEEEHHHIEKTLNKISSLFEQERQEIIAKIKTLQSANTEDNMIQLPDRFTKNEVFEEVLKKLKTNN